ncbi:MAG TPA: hypothetical protein VI479_18785 [Blastocatellia bacterium]
MASRGLKREEKRQQIAEARARLVEQAVGLLPKCDAELVDDNGEARAYSAKNPNFTAQAQRERWTDRGIKYSI